MVLLRVRNGASAVSKAFQGPFLQDFEVAGNRVQPPPLNIVDAVVHLRRLRHGRDPRRRQLSGVQPFDFSAPLRQLPTSEV
jgi:hypothetical protein